MKKDCFYFDETEGLVAVISAVPQYKVYTVGMLDDLAMAPRLGAYMVQPHQQRICPFCRDDDIVTLSTFEPCMQQKAS